MTIRSICLILSLLALVGPMPVSAQNSNRDKALAVLLDVEKADFATFFADIDGTFIIHDEAEGTTLIHNPERAKRRFSPWSTFEIPAAVMLLDSKTLSSVDEVVAWDATLYPAHPALPEALRKSWESPHSLKSAYQNYAPWFFRDQIQRIAPETVADYLRRFHYGNESAAAGNGFWLGKDLAVSASEQVAFLQNLVDRKFALKPDALDEALSVFVTKRTSSYTLALKTGSGATDGKAFGWAVGYVERGSRRYFFATNLDTDDYDELSSKRQEIVMTLLENLGLLD